MNIVKNRKQSKNRWYQNETEENPKATTKKKENSTTKLHYRSTR